MKLAGEFSAMIGETGLKVPGLGVIVYRAGEEVYSKFLGLRDVKRKLPVTRDTRFRIASVSKPFTIFSILQLVEQGKLNLEEEASCYLGFELRNPNQSRAKITVRMLASHVSSLRDGKIYSIPPQFSVEEFFTPRGKFWEDGAHFAPAEEKVGEYFTYSNLNYGLLGTIIERVTGERFDLYQRENILRQLETRADYLPGNFSRREFEMLGTVYQKKNSCGHWDERGSWFGKADDFDGVQPARNTISLQNPYDENFQGEFSLEGYRVGTNATIFSPQGGLRISFEELAHALEMLINEGVYRGRRILERESLLKMFEPQWIYEPKNKNGNTYGGSILNYGLGMYSMNFKICAESEMKLVGHTGAAFGLYAGIFVIPRTKSGFIYIINGAAISEEDTRSRGRFSNNYIWEEEIMNSLCKLLNKF